MPGNKTDETIPVLPVLSERDSARLKFSEGIDNQLRLKFAQMAEQDQNLREILARVETTTTASQLQVHEQLADIRSSITELTTATIDLKRLRDKMEEKQREHDFFKKREANLEKSVMDLSAHILDLQEAQKIIKRGRIFFNINALLLILLALIVVYHVFLEGK